MIKAEQVAEFFMKLQIAIDKNEFERTPQEKKWIEKIKLYNEMIEQSEKDDQEDSLPF